MSVRITSEALAAIGTEALAVGAHDVTIYENPMSETYTATMYSLDAFDEIKKIVVGKDGEVEEEIEEEIEEEDFPGIPAGAADEYEREVALEETDGLNG